MDGIHKEAEEPKKGVQKVIERNKPQIWCQFVISDGAHVQVSPAQDSKSAHQEKKDSRR